ncbi:MAG: hypothetical protein JWQ44_2957 [Chthoniobacter sp.]|nr:hypothetical protein [Chthoniobacter sp.]
MAKTPTTPAPIQKDGPIGAYRVQGIFAYDAAGKRIEVDGFATYDATGRTQLCTQADAERVGIRGAGQ